MKYEIDCDALTTNEVAHQLLDSVLAPDERVGEARLECGCDLEVDILHNDPSDPCIDGSLSHVETFTLGDIRYELCEGDIYCWAKDENGTDVLLCNN